MEKKRKDFSQLKVKLYIIEQTCTTPPTTAVAVDGDDGTLARQFSGLNIKHQTDECKENVILSYKFDTLVDTHCQ